MDAHIGKTLDGRYELLEVIGTGGMAVVYKAMDHRLNRQVAVKVLKSELAQNAEFRRRFYDEAQAVAMLSHPNIVSVYDVSHDTDTEYIVMELIDGISLKQYMERRGQLNWREALHFITQIMKGLGHAHSRGIIHRDIKPHNIMILRDGSVKVADFGIACLIASAENTLTQEALGSVHYISPEQAKGSHTDARADIYSAGVVLYEMLTNRLPFEGDSAVSIAIQHISSVPLSPREIDPEIPEALELITMRAMAPDMEKRYPSAEAMIHDLDEFRKNPNINFDYVLSDFAVEETTEPTQPIRTGEGSGRHVRRDEYYDRRRDGYDEEYYEDDGYDRRRGSYRKKKQKSLMIGAILAAVAVIAVLFTVIFSSFGGDGQEEYLVPSLLGMTVQEALSDPEIADHFTIITASNEFDEQPEGTIISQDPEGNRTKKGPKEEKHEITVVVSMGPQTDKMRDLIDMDERSAEAILDSMDLSLNIVKEEDYHETIEEGHVIYTEPARDAELKKGDTVKLVVSRGKKVVKVTLISYEGQDIEAAKADVEAKGLVFGGATEVESELPKGQVIDQNPKAATEVEEGTQVTFTVSAGPKEPEPPQTVSVARSYKLPEGEGHVYVQILVGNEVQFESNMDKALGTVNCTLTGSGTQQVYVKYDGVVMINDTVEFS